jgi:alpha-glucosidase
MAPGRRGDGDERRRPDAITSWEVEGDVARMELGEPRMEVSATAPGVLRVRFSPSSAVQPVRPWAVVAGDLTPLPLSAHDEGDGVAVVAGGLRAAVGPGGCLDVMTDDGRVIDADARGPSWLPDREVAWTRQLPPGHRYYGFGERTGHLDKRGRRYTAWTMDRIDDHGPGMDEMYVAIPFHLVLSPDGHCHGVFVNSTWRSRVDVSELFTETLAMCTEGPELELFFFAGPTAAEVLDRYTALTGRPALHPRWALGFQQTRWSYSTEHQVREVAAELRRRRIPADVIGIDIDHLADFRVFTWDHERFPDPGRLIDDLARDGFKVVTIVDPGVKVDEGYEVYDEGVARRHFLVHPDGSTFTGIVWPGQCALPDFARAEVRDWWGGWHRTLADVGVRGVLNDMNEPSLRDRPLDDPAARRVEPPGDLVHHDGEHVATHREVHNVYGSLHARAAAEGLRRLRPDERSFVVTRSGFAGVQRHAAVWTGDNGSYWEHLRMSLPQLLGLGLSGVPMAGADVGGFWGSCDAELLVRWMQAAALQPIMRANNSNEQTPQEPWVWGEEVEAACRSAIELRYRLLPYLYTCLAASHRTGAPMLRPLWWHDPADAVAQTLDDEALVGGDLLTAPVLQPGAVARSVYLPAGRWFDWHRGSVHEGPISVLVEAPLAGPSPLFARGGAVVPTGPVLQWTDEATTEPLTLHVFPDAEGHAAGELYEDDGRSFDHERGAHATTRFRFDGATLGVDRVGELQASEQSMRAVVHGDDGTAEDLPFA